MYPCSELRIVESEEDVGKEAARQEYQLGGGRLDAHVVGQLHQEYDGERHAVQQTEPLRVGEVVEVFDSILRGHHSRHVCTVFLL